VQGWLSDAVSSGNTFADALLQHLYRWLCRLVFDLRLIYCTNLQLNDTFCQELVHYDFLVVVMHIISLISFHLWCMLGGSVWIWIKSNLFWFIECQTHISTSWHAKMRLILWSDLDLF
jgi:hypothetical protein